MSLQKLTSDPSGLTVYYDSLCPICAREIRWLRPRAQSGSLAFVDIHEAHQKGLIPDNLSHAALMGQIHAVRLDGKVFCGVEALAEIYSRCGLGWLSWLLRAPFLSALARLGYSLFARHRLRIGRLLGEDINTRG
jgi:predicted DCC family thiol-disulfide oxidoreductase YuxK